MIHDNQKTKDQMFHLLHILPHVKEILYSQTPLQIKLLIVEGGHLSISKQRVIL